MWSQSSKFTVVWFYLSSRIVISLSSHYWNLVFRIGQSFPAIIASICYTNTCVPAIKFYKALQTPHAPFDGDFAVLIFHLHSVWIGNCLAAGCCLKTAHSGGSMVFAVRLQWQMENRYLPWKPIIVVMSITSYTLIMS